MKKIPMIANKEIYFDGRMVKPEEHFESEERFVEILTLSRAARRDDDAPVRSGRGKRGQYSRRDMVAESQQ